MNKLLFLSIALPFITFQSTFSQSQFKNLNINGFTTPENIQVIHDQSELSGFQKGDHIFGKARGFFSISPINSINNRALLKLKTEASMKGASHIFIDYRNIENSVFSKTAMYSAHIYRASPLNLNDVKNKLAEKDLNFSTNTVYKRNRWRTNSNLTFNMVAKTSVSEPYSSNGKLFIKIDSANNGKEEAYEIIAYEGDKMLLLQENKRKNKVTLHRVELR